jgi:hypothetical protein
MAENETQRAVETANAVLEKPVKVRSGSVDAIVRKARKIIRENGPEPRE